MEWFNNIVSGHYEMVVCSGAVIFFVAIMKWWCGVVQ